MSPSSRSRITSTATKVFEIDPQRYCVWSGGATTSIPVAAPNQMSRPARAIPATTEGTRERDWAAARRSWRARAVSSRTWPCSAWPVASTVHLLVSARPLRSLPRFGRHRAERHWGRARPVLEPEQVGVGLRLAGVAAAQRAKARGVRGLDQVGELVDQHGVEHPLRHRSEAGGDPDLAGRRRARAPPPHLVRHEAHRARPYSSEMAVGDLLGPPLERRVRDGARSAPPVVEHPEREPGGDPLALGDGELDRHDDDHLAGLEMGLRALSAPRAHAAPKELGGPSR